MNANPLVSVIIPTYNRAHTVRRAVDCVLAQTWKNIEIIVVDDGSKDDTGKVLEAYGEKIRFIHQSNQGQSVARNTGIQASTGQIISFLDSDDEWLPAKTEKQVSLLLKSRSQGVTCSLCNARLVYPGGAEKTSFGEAGLHPRLKEGIWTNPVEILMSRFVLFNQCVDIWRDALDQAGVFRAELRVLEDYDLALRLALAGGAWGYQAEPQAIWYGSEEPSASKVGTAHDHNKVASKLLMDLKGNPKWGDRVPGDLFRQRMRLMGIRIAAYRLSQGPGKMKQSMGRLLSGVSRIVHGVYRRSNLYPVMKVTPAPASGNVSVPYN